MPNADQQVLSARSHQKPRTVPATFTVEQAMAAAGGAWLVVADDVGEPAAAVAPSELAQLDRCARLRDLLPELHGVLVVEVDTTTDVALRSWAFDQADRRTVVVFVRSGDVVGLWAGQDLAVMLARAHFRVLTDAHLPGNARIPLLVRVCGFQNGARRCTATRAFAEYPDPMPACTNPDTLADHVFVW